MKKCGNCKHFIVKHNEIELARHAPHVSQCQPGMPHCLGGQVRGACAVWQERAERGYKMPWGLGPMVESTFFCRLWKEGGPTPRTIGGANRKTDKGGMVLAGLAVLSLVLQSAARGFQNPFRRR
jgi:hypothetical protein